MITIEEKEYDLKYLLNYDMLREILIKLAQNQNILQKDVESIKNTNKERDYKLMKLEKMIKEQEKEKDIIDDFELIQKEDKLKEKRELESQNNNININEEEKEEQDENEELQKTEKIKDEEEKGKNEEKEEKEEKKERKENKGEKLEKKEERIIIGNKSGDKIGNIKEDINSSNRQKNKIEDIKEIEEKKMTYKSNNYIMKLLR